MLSHKIIRRILGNRHSAESPGWGPAIRRINSGDSRSMARNQRSSVDNPPLFPYPTLLARLPYLLPSFFCGSPLQKPPAYPRAGLLRSEPPNHVFRCEEASRSLIYAGLRILPESMRLARSSPSAAACLCKRSTIYLQSTTGFIRVAGNSRVTGG